MSPEQRLQIWIEHHLTWLQEQRWFGDKSRPAVAARLLAADVVQVGGSHLYLNIVELTHEWGENSLYFLPLVENGSDDFSDATQNVGILRWLVSGCGQGRVIRGAADWIWQATGASIPQMDTVTDEEIRPISSEQSNSSIIFGERAIVKLFRRIQPGINPDLEIGKHFARLGNVESVPALLGTLSVEFDDQRIDLLALQEFVPNRGDGWLWLLQELAMPDRRPSLRDELRKLGERTAAMHLALAEPLSDESFQPQPATDDDVEAVIDRIIAEMEGTVEELTRHMPPHQVEVLHKQLGTMMGDAWGLLRTRFIRVHGDFHLGQTLRTNNDDFMIIDFEGEPARPMQERRVKLPALKDIAGMVRSLDYAAATVMQSLDDSTGKALLRSWSLNASRDFVDVWRTVITRADPSLIPRDTDVFQRCLNLLIAEKALYEVRYELNNRPDWLWIPVEALQHLVDEEAVD